VCSFGELNDSEHINRTLETIKQRIKTSAKDSLGLYELKQHKPWFDEECLRFLDLRKQAKMQWIQDPNQSKSDSVSNRICEASRDFRNKKEGTSES